MSDFIRRLAAELRLANGAGGHELAAFLDPPANDDVPKTADTADADSLLIDVDDAEAERFRIECARDAAADQDDDW